MANRNIDESIRKPRRTKGTPFYVQRNYYAAGIIAIGGIFWALYELWPESKKLKQSFLEGKFANTSPDLRNKFLETELSVTKPVFLNLISGLKARANAR